MPPAPAGRLWAQPWIRVTLSDESPVRRSPSAPDHTGRDPVIGELAAAGFHEIVIRRSNAAIGEVCVHFPRAGFVVAPA